LSSTRQAPTSEPARWLATDEVIIDALRGQILHGAYATTRPLPDTARLAAEFGLPKEVVAAAKAELERYVRRAIEEGTYPLHSQIPSWQSLGEKYGLTAYQAGLALKPLVNEGLLRSPGSRGTYVAIPARAES
jgi:DNA-binding GntR family transcriptional regulator